MQAITTVVPRITRTVIDQGLTRRVPGVLGRELTLLLALGLARWACGGLRRWISGGVGTDVEVDLRNQLARHLLALEPGWHDRAQTGQLLSRFGADIRSVRYFLSWGLVFSLLNLLVLVMAAVQMWLLSPRLTVVAIALGPPLVAGAVRYNRRLHTVFWQVQQELGDLATVVEENSAGIRVVKAFGREAEQAALLDTEARSIMTESLRAARLSAFYNPLLAALPQVSLAGIVWYGGRMASQGEISLGTLVAFTSYLVLLAWPLQSLGMLFGFAQRAAASAERVFEVLDRPPLVADRAGAAGRPGRGEPRDRAGVAGGAGRRHRVGQVDPDRAAAAAVRAERRAGPARRPRRARPHPGVAAGRGRDGGPGAGAALGHPARERRLRPAGGRRPRGARRAGPRPARPAARADPRRRAQLGRDGHRDAHPRRAGRRRRRRHRAAGRPQAGHPAPGRPGGAAGPRPGGGRRQPRRAGRARAALPRGAGRRGGGGRPPGRRGADRRCLGGAWPARPTGRWARAARRGPGCGRWSGRTAARSPPAPWRC